MRNTLLLSLLAVALLVTPSHAVVTKSAQPVTLLSGTGLNEITVAATLTSRITSSDSDTVTASGILYGDFTYAFSDADLNHPTLKSLNINNGTFALGDIHLGLQAKVTTVDPWLGIPITPTVNVNADTDNVTGIVRTQSPPAIVTGGTTFAGNKQKATINNGTQTITASYIGFPLYEDTTSFSANNAWGYGSGNGTAITTFLSKNGFTYTYKLHIELPLAITQSDDIVFDSDDTIHYTLNATGTAIAEGTFTQVIIPGDANWDGIVNASDATILAGNWQYDGSGTAADATWEVGDFNGDNIVNASDATILAGNWQANGGGAAVPEPGTIALLLSALAGLALIRRS